MVKSRFVIIQIMRKDSKETWNLLRRATDLSRNNHDYASAIKVYDDALEGLIHDTILVLISKAANLTSLKRYDEVSDCDEKILSCYESLPDKSDIYYFTGKAGTLRSLRRYDEAIKCYDEALNHEAFKEESGTRVKLFQYKIELLKHLKRYDEAIEVCDKAIQSFPRYFSEEKQRVIEERDKNKSKIN